MGVVAVAPEAEAAVVEETEAVEMEAATVRVAANWADELRMAMVAGAFPLLRGTVASSPSGLVVWCTVCF